MPVLAPVSAPKVEGITFPVLEFAAVPMNTPGVFTMPKNAVPELLVNGRAQPGTTNPLPPELA